MEPKFYKEKLGRKNEFELTAAFIVLIEKINSEREKWNNQLKTLNPESKKAIYTRGAINSYNTILGIIDILL